MAEARSTWDKMTPPKMVPYAFVSLGRSRTLMAGMREEDKAPQAYFVSPESLESGRPGDGIGLGKPPPFC
jgi:hypothetical protein